MKFAIILLGFILIGCTPEYPSVISAEAFYKNQVPNLNIQLFKHCGQLGIRGGYHIIWIDTIHRGFGVNPNGFFRLTLDEIDAENKAWFCSSYPIICIDERIPNEILQRLYQISLDAKKFGFTEIRSFKKHGVIDFCLEDGITVLRYIHKQDSTTKAWSKVDSTTELDSQWSYYNLSKSVLED